MRSTRLVLMLPALTIALMALVSCGGSDSGSASEPTSEELLGVSGTVLGAPKPRPDFTLTTTEGEPFRFAEETAGRLTLLFFGFTSCPDICPVHLATLAGALGEADMPKPVVVFVGVDRERDTPQVLRAYLDQFDESFIGLTGTAEELEAAQLSAGVAPAVIGEPDENGDYEVGHAGQILAYTPDDLNHIVYPFGVRRQDWVSDLPRLSDLDWSKVHDTKSQPGAPLMSVSGAAASTGSDHAAVYAVISNAGDVADRLVGAELLGDRSADDVSIHDTVQENGRMRMQERELVEVPAGGRVVLEPGALHVMLSGLATPIEPGDEVTISLRFERAGPIEVTARAVSPADVADLLDEAKEAIG